MLEALVDVERKGCCRSSVVSGKIVRGREGYIYYLGKQINARAGTAVTAFCEGE